ncbi:formate acetyltransferase 3 [Salmonella enterica subsp. enterica serovar Heidelberg str. RI-11-014316]|nr:formate acetyltransferase 3 [Salmonella enterica subsp. enterica serovar Heidelberg str. RI-11-014316]
MTQLKLDTLSDRIKAHKTALVHIVKPPVCTERAQHYTEMYQQHLDKPIPVRRALALAHHLAERTIWIKHDELIVGNQASEVRAAPIFPEYTVSWIEKEIDDLADRPGAGFSEVKKQAYSARRLSVVARSNRPGSLLRHVYR